MSSLDQIKSLRERTGAGVVDVKKALDEAGGDETKALEILKKRGKDKALKKSDREAHEGVIGSYVHTNGKVAAMVKVLCETDFVARNADFVALSRDIAMHIVASDPKYLRPEDVLEEAVEKERMIWREQLAAEKKPEAILETILAGKEKKFREESALLTQPFVKDPNKMVGEVLTDAIARIGENIQIGEFRRFEI